MTPDQLSAAGLGLTILSWLAYLTYRAGQQNVKIETLWHFLLRRAEGEAIEKGIAVKNSPLTITPEAKAWMAELAEQLRKFYERLGYRLTETEMAHEIERRFGREISERVCIPNGISQGSCILIAMEVAKEAAQGKK